MFIEPRPDFADPHSFQLWDKQYLAFSSVATEILYGGAAGGGKSHLFRIAAIIWCLDIPGLQVYIFRRTYPDLNLNYMEGEGSFPELLASMVQTKKCKINYGDMEIEFRNGSKIFLRHCQHEKNMYGYQGAQMHVLIIDELTQFTAKIYRYLRSRLRKTTALPIPDHYKGLFPRVLCGANPGGIGHNWVKMEWIDNAPAYEITDMPKARGGMRRQFIPAVLEDNPSLDPAEYEGKLEGLGDPNLVKAMRHGDWDIVSGGMFDDVWNREVHILDQFPIPDSWYIDRAFDWGSARPFSVGWWAESDGSDVKLASGKTMSTVKGDLFRIAEWYGWSGEPDEGLKLTAEAVAHGIVEIELALKIHHRVQPGPADTSIWDEENANCIARDMEKPVRIGNKVYRGVTWTRADKSPGSIAQGCETIRKRLLNSKRKKGSPREKPGLFVFSNCVQFIRVLPTAPRDDLNREVVHRKYEDHIIDETRYRVRHEKRIARSGRTTGGY